MNPLLTGEPVQDGTFVGFSFRRQVDGELHLTLQLHAAEETQAWVQSALCLCSRKRLETRRTPPACSTFHARKPSGSRRRTCWRRPEWEPSLICTQKQFPHRNLQTRVKWQTVKQMKIFFYKYTKNVWIHSCGLIRLHLKVKLTLILLKNDMFYMLFS